MKNKILCLLLSTIIIVLACKNETKPKISEEQIWKLGWRMIESSFKEKDLMAEAQFDSLLMYTKKLDKNFLITGLETKSKFGRKAEVTSVLNAQNPAMLQQICSMPFLANFEACKNSAEEKVENQPLQMELLNMFVQDQAVRGKVLTDLINKYAIDNSQISTTDKSTIDAANQKRLKEIIQEAGFPTRKLVGKDAVQGAFFIIQHADGDKEWQQSQLKNIERAVKNGDLDGQRYAYLYDRIRVDSGEKQVYGTQFEKIDRAKKTVRLSAIEDAENLDNRRRQIGMMPIEMYKKLVLQDL